MKGTVGVIGSGNMGSAIAELLSFNGYQVLLKDVNLELTRKGKKNIENILSSNVTFQARRAEKEIKKIESYGILLTEEQKDRLRDRFKPDFSQSDSDDVLSRIAETDNYSEFDKCNFVVEAVFERLDVKTEIFREVSSKISENAILASNTSSLSITELAGHAAKPENVIVTHFFNPPYTLPLVEIVRAIQTSESTFKKTYEFIAALRNHRGSMVPIGVKEVPGFLVNRILVPVMNEAAMILDEGVATKEDIDKAMKYGAGFPMGPLELSDMVGLDIVLDVQDILYSNYGDPKYRPSILLKRLVEAGKLGKKTGEGYYSYSR